jgi:hypothetical protein
METLTLSAPSVTAAVARCPQCNGIARLTLVEPHVSDPDKEWHVFRCEACSATRTYMTAHRL